MTENILSVIERGDVGMKDCGERQNNEVSDGSEYTGRQDIPVVTVVVQQQQDDMMMVINTGTSYVTKFFYFYSFFRNYSLQRC